MPRIAAASSRKKETGVSAACRNVACVPRRHKIVRAGDAPVRFPGAVLWKVILLPLVAGFMGFLLDVAVLVASLPPDKR
ncbi:MAG TPA: hypothetical protein VIW28_10810 [Gemmatimonadales bacterium]|jgi:hypothetical protein